MKKSEKGCSRRNFLKIAGAAGAGSLILSNAHASLEKTGVLAAKNAEPMKVPTRSFGRSRREVSILSLGGMFDLSANQLMLKQAIKWGVTYWDTADCYHRGSERGIGKYFERNPKDREKIFLVSKSDNRDPEGMSKLLERSLKRLKTSYLDLYFVHAIRSISELDDNTRRWAQKAKAEKKIRLFGFSTHSNMEQCMLEAAKLDWIDGIMMTYNFRNLNTPLMKKALDACYNAGIGLTAMKTQGSRTYWKKANEEPLKIYEKEGLTIEQAKLALVWENPKISAICSQMDTMKLLQANVEAAVRKKALSSHTKDLLERYALETSGEYCAGCSDICESACGNIARVTDIMRHHMYNRSYGKPEWAREYFEHMPRQVRLKLAQTDFEQAEKRCPNKLPITQLVRQALDDYL
ncbi:MAG: aldo/keto reductase [Desulfobacteraceae bacterium]|nr:aldo/keto reductase [Desulfobacteraceae bacterium]